MSNSRNEPQSFCPGKEIDKDRVRDQGQEKWTDSYFFKKWQSEGKQQSSCEEYNRFEMILVLLT